MTTEIKSLHPQSVWGYFYELTQIPRPTGHMEAVTRYIFDFGKKLNLETEQDGVGNVIIRKPASPGFEDRKAVVLQSHLDIVSLKSETHDYTKDPIPAYVDGDWVRAKGTTLGADNGIGAAMSMALLADNSLKHGALETLFTVDEEVGMDGANGLKPGFVHGRILLNCDSEDEGILFIGCAGGADLNVTFKYKKGAPLISGDVAVQLSLSGLKGGHSGLDIHLGRANANKLMFRFLKEAVRDYGVRLATVNGGFVRNAIPSEAKAVITLPKDNVEPLWELVSDYQDLYRAEFAGSEDNIQFRAEMTELPFTLIPEQIQDDLINAVVGCRNGVATKLADFPDVVESSSSLSVIQSSEGLIEIKILVRSASESRKTALVSSLESVFSLAGAKVEEGGAYNGWQPAVHSPILKVMVDTYLKMYGKRPEVEVIHAGLECGIIQGVYPDMDMISFGPNLQHPHSTAEAVSISSVARTWDYLKSVLENIPE